MGSIYLFQQTSIQQSLMQVFLPVLQDSQVFFNEILRDGNFYVFLEEESRKMLFRTVFKSHYWLIEHLYNAIK